MAENTENAPIEVLARFEAEAEQRQKVRAARCLVCLKPLRPGERKVHRGPCARERQTQLQRGRRMRGRL